jgi:hypothetical protein
MDRVDLRSWWSAICWICLCGGFAFLLTRCSAESANVPLHRRSQASTKKKQSEDDKTDDKGKVQAPRKTRVRVTRVKSDKHYDKLGRHLYQRGLEDCEETDSVTRELECSDRCAGDEPKKTTDPHGKGKKDRAGLAGGFFNSSFSYGGKEYVVTWSETYDAKGNITEITIIGTRRKETEQPAPQQQPQDQQSTPVQTMEIDIRGCHGQGCVIDGATGKGKPVTGTYTDSAGNVHGENGESYTIVLDENGETDSCVGKGCFTTEPGKNKTSTTTESTTDDPEDTDEEQTVEDEPSEDESCWTVWTEDCSARVSAMVGLIKTYFENKALFQKMQIGQPSVVDPSPTQGSSALPRQSVEIRACLGRNGPRINPGPGGASNNCRRASIAFGEEGQGKAACEPPGVTAAARKKRATIHRPGHAQPDPRPPL